MSAHRVLSLPTLLSVFSFVAVAGDISGTYAGKNPANGLTVTFNLKSDGSNLNGSMVNGIEMPFSDGRVDNDGVSFTVKMPPYKDLESVSNFTGTVDGDRIHLTCIVVVSDGRSKPFKGKPIKFDVTRQSLVSNATPATPATVANGQSGPGGESKVAPSGGATYKIAFFAIPNEKWTDGILTVRNFAISYPNGENPGSTAILSCSEVGKIGLPTADKDLKFKIMDDWLLLPKASLRSREKDLKRAELYQRIKDTCSTQEAAHLEEQARERERQQAAAARQLEEQARERERQQAAATKRTADFRDDILAALHAAEEDDPFASIRGEFDLSAADSRQWKTSLHLPDAEKCALLKTAAPSPTSASAWMFGCLFRSSSDGYERIVKIVQSVLNLPFQPDERAVNMNQVFFADPSKPAWRFFATKTKDGYVGLSIVAVRFADAPASAANTTPFPAVPTMLPTDPAVSGEAVRAGQASHTGASDAQCQEYQRQELERTSKEQEVRRLGAELQKLQLQYQDASTKALQAQQSANNNGQAQTGVLGALNSAVSTLATTVAQQKQAEAQNLQTQITFKQSQLTNAQIGLSTLTRSAPPPGGCPAGGTAPK